MRRVFETMGTLKGLIRTYRDYKGAIGVPIGRYTSSFSRINTAGSTSKLLSKNSQHSELSIKKRWLKKRKGCGGPYNYHMTILGSLSWGIGLPLEGSGGLNK